MFTDTHNHTHVYDKPVMIKARIHFHINESHKVGRPLILRGLAIDTCKNCGADSNHLQPDDNLLRYFLLADMGPFTIHVFVL